MGWVKSDLIGMLREGQFPVLSFDLFLRGGLEHFPLARHPTFGRSAHTLDKPSISYGSQIFAVVLAVTAMRYTIQAISSQPAAAVIILFSLRCLRFCFHLCLSIRSACSGRKSDFILGAVLSSSGKT